jgi:hypothetical protein
MKKILFSIIFSTIALMTLNATATSLTVKGPITIAWTVYQSAGNTNHSTTNHTATSTNVVTVSKNLSKQFPFNNASLLKLLANSFNTTFPAGAHLVTDGNTVFVVDKTGSNVVLDISSVVSIQFSNNVQSGVGTDTRITTTNKTSFSGSGGGTETSYVILKYDDSSLTTADGTHSTFEFDGLSKGMDSDSFSGTFSGNSFTEKGTKRVSFNLTGAGAGTIQNTPSVIGGSVIGSASGPISF